MTNVGSLQLNAFLMNVKKINGKNYRINNIVKSMSREKVAKSGKDLKLFSITREMENNDDATSEEDYSQNISFLSESDNNDESIQDDEDTSYLDIDRLMRVESGVKSANTLIKNNSIVKQIKWTHFLSVPLFNNNEFVDKFEFLKQKILEENDIHNDLFQNKNRLHLTVCLLSITNNEMLKKLNQILSEAGKQIKALNDELYLDFDQLEVFGTPHKSRVLYTRPNLKNSEKYKDVVDIIITKLVESGLINDQMKAGSHIFYNKQTDRHENNKPHVTLLNSTFLKERQLFNGLKIIKRMNNFSFGVHKVTEFNLNEMRTCKDDMYVVNSKYLI
jgi:2'-5' RNA ligase